LEQYVKNTTVSLCALFLLLILFADCSTQRESLHDAESSINKTDLERHVVALASDDFQGRKPFTEGETKTVNYIKAEFEKMGLQGANNGSYFQDVPLVEITGTPSLIMEASAENETLDLIYMDDFIASTQRITEEIIIEKSELVFAGFGIVAPEYGWNDYKGIHVKGKTVLVLVNDPGFATQDESLFKGNAMTYYGRWTYKYEEAARQGATGIIVIHETKAAGYPWTVLQNGAAGADLALQSPDNNLSRCVMEGWVTQDAARKIFDATGYNLDALTKAAASRNFEAMNLNTHISLTITNKLRFDTSKNVLAMLPGTDRTDECIVYTAHWDHLGIGPAVNGDSIYNGAADNALPIACMLETAKAFSKLGGKLPRSVLFIAVTAEEAGLLGSAYYAANPVFPLSKTVANLNYELFLPLGRMSDVTIYGYGQSELDDYVAEAAKEQDRYATPEPFPENGMYFRTDHFSFAKAGVPALFIKGWSDHRDHGKDWTARTVQEFWANHYHRPSDEYDPDTADLAGIIEDSKLFFKIGARLSMEHEFPKWREGSEFKIIRDQNKNEDVH
jgi:Zn-dependent M28 family amino/carboxypeptidase